ncbi:IclR family transcriptional regulator [Brucella intermedia]|uniref:IclR family transcriptional regulator n=1 Tax=Brucella intermedia TaxID=94625 RepID=UPI00224AB977|nr:IclR family transcriptional regulator [Brucella intermedia]
MDRVIKLFSYLHSMRRPVRLAEIPRGIDAPRSTIYSLVGILADAGILEVNGDDNRVSFGKLMYIYGASYLRENSAIDRGKAAVDRLAEATGETSELCVRHNNRQLIVHTALGSRPLRISSEAGSEIPLPWTASGRILLSSWSENDINELLEANDFILPDRRSIDPDTFVAECHAARSMSTFKTVGLINSFSQCIAAPITDASGTPEATICLVLPLDLPASRISELEAELIDTARKISI